MTDKLSFLSEQHRQNRDKVKRLEAELDSLRDQIRQWSADLFGSQNYILTTRRIAVEMAKTVGPHQVIAHELVFPFWYHEHSDVELKQEIESFLYDQRGPCSFEDVERHARYFSSRNPDLEIAYSVQDVYFALYDLRDEKKVEFERTDRQLRNICATGRKAARPL